VKAGLAAALLLARHAAAEPVEAGAGPSAKPESNAPSGSR
jgi:hypothetical protein